MCQYRNSNKTSTWLQYVTFEEKNFCVVAYMYFPYANFYTKQYKLNLDIILSLFCFCRLNNLSLFAKSCVQRYTQNKCFFFIGSDKQMCFKCWFNKHIIFCLVKRKLLWVFDPKYVCTYSFSFSRFMQYIFNILCDLV